MASYIKANKDVTLQGTKRFTDKSGEYYLKNINLQNSKQVANKKNSLNNPQNLENCLSNIGKIKKRASKLVTLLPENSLTPIPKKEGINKLGMANGFGKKELKDAQRTAVFIRRLEYATTMKKQMDEGKNLKNQAKKIGLIQEWWKTMFKIIKLQKNMRGFLFRKKLMNNLEHQEKLLQFITEFDNIHNYHLYRQFMDNLKKKGDYEKAKLMEKCEDFNDKLDNLEKLRDLKNFKNCFEKWKNDTKQKKKDDLDNLAKTLNDVLKNRINKNNLETLKDIKDTIKSEEEKLDDKAKEFQEKNAKKKFMNDLIKAHRLNKILSNVKDKIDNRDKKDVLDKLKKDKDISDASDKLNKLLNDKMKKGALDDLKTMDFVDKVDDVINKHNDKENEDAKKDFMDKLKDINDKKQLKDVLNKWKNFNNEMNQRDKIINKLKRYKQNELKKKAEQEKNKFSISSGVNDFQLISDKKEEEPKKENPIMITSANDINIEAKPAPKMVFETAGQNFSLMAPEIIKFEFGPPIEKSQKIDNKKIYEQLDEINNFKNKNDLKKYMDKWKEQINKKDIMDKLKDKMNDLLKKQKVKEDKFKQVLDNLKKMEDKNDLKEYFDKWKNASDQIKKDNLDNLANKLNDILTKAKKESEDQNKKDFLDNLKKNNDVAKGVEKLDDFINTKPKKDAFETLKKNSGMSEGFRVLDKLCKKNDDKSKNDFLERLKKNAESQRALEDLNKLLEKKLKQKFMDNLKNNNDKKKGAEKINKIIGDNLKKDFMDKLKRRSDLKKAVEDLDKLINNKMKKNALDELKKKNNIVKYSDKLEKLIMDKLKKKFIDRLDRNNKIQNACDKLNKLMEDKLKKEAFDNLKNENNIKKGVDLLDKLIKDHNDKLKKDAFDELKKINDIAKAADKLEKLINDKLKKDAFDELKKANDIAKAADKLEDLMNDKLKKDAFDELKKVNDIAKSADKLEDLMNNKLKKNAFDELKKNDDIAKAADKLEKLINDKLKDDTLKKLKTMQFVDILEKMKKNKDDKDNKEKLNNLMNNLKKIAQDKKEEEDKNNKEKLRDYLDKWKDIVDRGKIKDKLVENAKKKKALDKWREKCEQREIMDKLKKYLNDLKKNKNLGDTIKKLDNNNLKKYFDKWKENAKNQPKNETKSKRISRRSNSKRPRTKSKKNNDKKLLKQAFDLWRENSSFEPTRDVLEKIKKNKQLKNNLENLDDEEKNDLLQKYKNKMLQVLLNIHKRQNNLLLKKYWDKWKKAKDDKTEPEKEEPKYKKKPRIVDTRDLTDSDTSSFNPTYYNPKKNLYKQRNKPYKKRYAKKLYEQPEEFKYQDTPRRYDNINDNITDNIDDNFDKNKDEDRNNIREINKEEYSDTSSNNESILGNGEYLIQNKKITKQPRNYTSQSFFIDKNNANNITPNNYQINTNNTNQVPMTMKGDFVSLIEQNPKILAQKNPRIQVTNATCDLNQIINNETTEDELNSEEVNYEIDKLNKNFTIDKNKVLSKVIQNCDKDLYASQRPFKSKKDPWYSVSIPLNDNEAKWEFLNNIKGERDKNNLNKFELIQNEEPIKEEKEEGNGRKSIRSDKKNKEKPYKLREMNYAQFYRSPMKSPKIEDDEKSLLGNRIKIPGQGERQNTHRSLLNTSRYRKSGRNNFERSRGKIEFDPKYRSIDYDNGYDLDDSDDE